MFIVLNISDSTFKTAETEADAVSIIGGMLGNTCPDDIIVTCYDEAEDVRSCQEFLEYGF